MGKLDGRVAIITGGGRGQGRSHAIALAREGANVVVCGLQHQPEQVKYPMFTEGDLEETVRLVEQEDQRAIAVTADVGDAEQVQHVVDVAMEEFGRVDIAIANAGFFIHALLHEMEEEAWKQCMDTHLTGVWHLLKSAAPHMIEQRWGRFIATSSAYGKQGVMNCGAYSAAKWGVIGLVKSAALELGQYGITCNAVCPSTIMTDASSNPLVPPLFFPDHPNPNMDMVDDFVRENWHPLNIGRMPPEDVSKVMVFLASEDARYISGSTVDVSAGLIANNAA
jgi:SDR family mycofactocin-dependent oxidoreductase